MSLGSWIFLNIAMTKISFILYKHLSVFGEGVQRQGVIEKDDAITQVETLGLKIQPSI